MQKERIHYLDIVKGIVILYVIAVHCVCWHTLFMGEYTNHYYFFALDLLFIFAPVSMPSFFLVHGMLPKKSAKFPDVFKYGATRLLLPMVLLYPFGEMWFFWAMFFALLIDNLTERIPNTGLKTIVIVLIALLGVCLTEYKLYWRAFYGACLLLPFFHIARQYGKLFGGKKLGLLGLVFMLSIIIIYVSYRAQYPFKELYPYISGKEFTNISFENAIPFYIIGIIGNFFVFWLAKSIKENPFLEYIGKNSLLFFLIHFWATDIVFRLTNLTIWQCSTSLPLTIAIYIVTYLAVFGFTYFAIKLINKYCPWIVGVGK